MGCVVDASGVVRSIDLGANCFPRPGWTPGPAAPRPSLPAPAELPFHVPTDCADTFARRRDRDLDGTGPTAYDSDLVFRRQDWRAARSGSLSGTQLRPVPRSLTRDTARIRRRSGHDLEHPGNRKTNASVEAANAPPQGPTNRAYARSTWPHARRADCRDQPQPS